MEKKELYRKFSDAGNGEILDRPVALVEVMDGIAKNGNPFVTLKITDGYSTIEARLFGSTKEGLAEKGISEMKVVDIKAHIKPYNGFKSVVVDAILPHMGDDLEISDFARTVTLNTELMYNKICEILRETENACVNGSGYEPITSLALAILEKYKDIFLHSAASMIVHHNLSGGLVYHTARMVCAARRLTGVYPVLDKKLLLSGAALHDIGKVLELVTTPLGDASYTTKGSLMGHLYIGSEMVHDEASKGNYDPEEVMLLQHMILSHHGKEEWGAVKPPATPEAIVLHYIDQIDGNLYQMEEQVQEIPPGTCTVKKPFGLDNVIYRSAG